MGWRKNAKREFIFGRFFKGFYDGSVDELSGRFTDAEVLLFRDSADRLDRCKPWHNHLNGDAYDEINKALKHRDPIKAYKKARAAVEKHASQTADPSCISELKSPLTEVITKCTSLLEESLPKDIVIP